MYDFSTLQLFEIVEILRTHTQNLPAKSIVEFKVLNPDIAHSIYNGNTLHVNNQTCIHRGYKTWTDLAHQLSCRMLTPKADEDEHFVTVRYQKLSDESFHALDAPAEKKYGDTSIFSKIHKNEESGFLHYYLEALQNVKLHTKKRVLNLGVNHADEFELIRHTCKEFDNIHFCGIDYCESAIQKAKQKFAKHSNVEFFTHDITQLGTLVRERYDLIISIGTLQSSNLKLKELLPSLVQNILSPKGAIILAFPNCRWRDGEMIYGAKMKNYNFSELSNLFGDVVWCKKYLQQKKFRVTITGKDYIFLTATSIRKD